MLPLWVYKYNTRTTPLLGERSIYACYLGFTIRESDFFQESIEFY
jgi:hypothetical protein